MKQWSRRLQDLEVIQHVFQELKKKMFYGTGALEKGDILGLPVMQKVYEAGKNVKNQ